MTTRAFASSGGDYRGSLGHRWRGCRNDRTGRINGPEARAPLAAQVQPSRDFPRNAHGLSYGSSEQATSDDQVPDLVLVYATNGKLGYVAKSDLIAKAPMGPQQAIASKSANSRATTIAVCAVDGVTKIGDFLRQPGHPN